MDSSFYSSYSDASTEQLFVDTGNKNNLLPPLMQAVDTYVESASDMQVQLLHDSTTSAKKKKKAKGRKTKKKGSQVVPEVKTLPSTMTMIAGDLSSSFDRPESRGFSSRESNPLLYSVGRHSAWEDVPPAVPSLDSQWSSDSTNNINSKNTYSDSSSTVLEHGIKLFPISPPADFNINSKSKFSLHSPHRSINVPVVVAGAAIKTRDNNNHLLSPMIPVRNNNNNNNNNVFIKSFAQSIPANKKTDLGFNRALQSIAAIKLHNFAMRRRNHVTQKLKVTCLH